MLNIGVLYVDQLSCAHTCNILSRMLTADMFTLDPSYIISFHLDKVSCVKLTLVYNMASFDKESKYSSLTLKQLKIELKKRNARRSGRKRELIKRYIVCHLGILHCMKRQFFKQKY